MKKIKFDFDRDYLVIQLAEGHLSVQHKKKIKEGVSKAFPPADGRIIVLGADENLTVVSIQ
jgi:hypothetical protein